MERRSFFAKERISEILYVTLGAALLSISVNAIFLPNKIVAGGANGLSIVINYLFGIEPALLLFCINVPLLILCFLLLGKQVGMKTIYGSMILPLFVGLTSKIPTLTHTPLLAAIFGGIVTGLGLGLVFKGNASTGGTAIIAQIIHKFTHLPMGTCVSMIDGLVILTAFLAFDTDRVLYSLIALFMISRVVDMVQTSFNRSKNVLIISDKAEIIKHNLLTIIDRGVTTIPVEGGYSEKARSMLMCVLPENDFKTLKDHVLEIDPQAFVVVMSASEVMGIGFSLKKI